MPVALFVSARRGDPAAFAQFVEHWDRHLRPFVHITLCRPEETDKVLQAAYVAAYRALPRYRARHTPGLWLHRLAFRAAVDEIRRQTRDPIRRRPAPDAPPARPVTSAIGGPDGFDPLARLRRLVPDQRAIVTMVDLEGFDPAAVADAFAVPEVVVGDRLRSARAFLDDGRTLPLRSDDPPPEPPVSRRRAGDPSGVLGGALVSPSPDPPPLRGPDPAEETDDGPPGGREDPFAVPAWMADESVNLIDDHPKSTETQGLLPGPPTPDPSAQAPPAKAVLAEVEVPPASPSFWSDLGRTLLAERSRPATPPPDPAARLARNHPAEQVRDEPAARSGTPAAISTIADRADRTRPPRRWGRPLAIVAGIVVVLAGIAGAIAFGVSDRVPDGTTTAPEVAASLATVLDASRYLAADAVVERPASGDTRERYRITLAENGSWAAERTDAIDRATLSAPQGAVRHVAAVTPKGAAPVVLASDERGLAPGPPDPTATPPDPIAALADIGPLMRAARNVRVQPITEDGTEMWSFRQTVATGADGANEGWHVVLRRADTLPVLIERRAGTRVVLRIRYAQWQPRSEVADGFFLQPLPPDAVTSATDHGFQVVDLAGAEVVGRGPAVTPSWLPTGFDLISVVVRGDRPLLEPSTAGGSNPPDVGVISVSYGRGPERITVTTRSAAGRAADWVDPFEAMPAATTRTPLLGDGRFNQSRVQLVADADGSAHLWGIADDVVFTVGGDLTSAEALRVASSLR